MVSERDQALAWEQEERRRIFAKARFTDRPDGEFTRLMNNYRAACRAIERAEANERAQLAAIPVLSPEEN